MVGFYEAFLKKQRGELKNENAEEDLDAHGAVSESSGEDGAGGHGVLVDGGASNGVYRQSEARVGAEGDSWLHTSVLLAWWCCRRRCSGYLLSITEPRC